MTLLHDASDPGDYSGLCGMAVLLLFITAARDERHARMVQDVEVLQKELLQMNGISLVCIVWKIAAWLILRQPFAQDYGKLSQTPPFARAPLFALQMSDAAPSSPQPLLNRLCPHYGLCISPPPSAPSLRPRPRQICRSCYVTGSYNCVRWGPTWRPSCCTCA